MTLQIGRFTPYEHLAASLYAPAGKVAPHDAQSPAHQKPTGVQESGAIVGEVPPAPTPEARELVNKAAEVVDQLHKSNRELHFTKDHSTNRVVIEVRDLDGNVLKTIPPAKALDVLSGSAEL
jgi:flagellar protein FlaG